MTSPRPTDDGYTAVDVHAHHFPDGLTDLASVTGDGRWPSLVRDDDVSGRIMLGQREFRNVRSSLWDVPQRIAELDAAGIDIQLVSPVPITLTDWAPAREAAEFAHEMNDGIAADVAASRGRLVGLGALPVQDIDAAIAELERVVTSLGLRGVEIGCRLADRELDDPHVRPLFEAAAALGAVVYVHPLGGGDGALRRTGQPYDFGLGMLTDTALAAGALVFGGVLRQLPDLQVVMSHGCGTFPWALPRLRLGAIVGGDAASDHTDLARRLWVDTLVFDAEHLRLLAQRFGPEHIMLGTDHPFIPGQLEDQPAQVRAAVERGILNEAQARGVLGGNALDLMATDRITASMEA
jgi:aminocarboxymuconate-semialdehyde decarboxylase